MGQTRVTIADVARAAGVGIGSASRALNGKHASPEMIERVTRAAQELGFTINERGRALRSHVTHQVTFAVADIGNPVYVEMLTGVQEVLEPHGYRIVIASIGEHADTAIETVRSLQSGLADGLILSPLQVNSEFVAELASSSLPTVIIGRAIEGAHVDSIATDSVAGVGMVVDELVSQGCRRIAFLNGPSDTTPGRSRREGLSRALANRPDVQAEVWEAPSFTIEAGYDTASDRLRGAPDTAVPDAVLAANDLMAIGAIGALREIGREVPRDVAVTGIDDTLIGRVYRPALTSLSLMAKERGRLAARRLLARIDDPDSPREHVVVRPELRVRESSQRGEGTR